VWDLVQREFNDWEWVYSTLEIKAASIPLPSKKRGTCSMKSAKDRRRWPLSVQARTTTMRPNSPPAEQGCRADRTSALSVVGS